MYTYKFNKLSVSNIFIFISIFVTFLSFFFDTIFAFWMNHFFINQQNYLLVTVQFLLYQFIHWWILHLFSNAIFIYIFWNQVEILLWEKKYFLFFVLNTIFVWVALLFLSSGTTVWISGFAMAILAYVFLELKKRNNPEYKWAWVFLLINIFIWLWSSISLVGHLFWAIFWIIYFVVLNENLKTKIYNFFK
jgi:membrane associated rhomboid family serine protease